jgi:hypothetical protein
MIVYAAKTHSNGTDELARAGHALDRLHARDAAR